MGTTLVALPVSRGYWRSSNRSASVLLCADAGKGCRGNATCDGSMSGCRGSTDVDLICELSLQGPFCKLCRPHQNATDLPNTAGPAAVAVRVYYKPATSSTTARCEPCGSLVAVFCGVATVVVIVCIGLSTLGVKSIQRFVSPTDRARAGLVWRRFTLATKLKILIGFYMIASMIGSIYEVTLPADVHRLLSTFDAIVSFGLPLVDTPLQCMGAGRFTSRLLFFMLTPPTALLLVFAAHVAQQSEVRRGKDSSASNNNSTSNDRTAKDTPTRSSRAAPQQVAAPARMQLLLLLQDAVVSAMPTAVKFLFFAYPILSNAAFKAFPCHDFGMDGRYLIADVSIRCDTAEHNQTMTLAWFTIFMYPIGLALAVASCLLYHKAELRGGSPTCRICEASAFLHGNYSADAYYWELCEMGRRFLLVGIAVLVEPGRICLVLGTWYLVLDTCST